MTGDMKFAIGAGIVGAIAWALWPKKGEGDILEYGPPNVGAAAQAGVTGLGVVDLRPSGAPQGSGSSSRTDCLCMAGDEMPGQQVLCGCDEPGAIYYAPQDMPIGALGAISAAGGDVNGVI